MEKLIQVIRVLAFICITNFNLLCISANAQGQGQGPGDHGNGVGPPDPTMMSVNCDQGETIQDAVDAAIGPTTIEVTGHCVEQVGIADKSINIIGVGANAVITAPPGGSAFYIAAARVNIQYMDIYGFTQVQSSSTVGFRDNIVRNVSIFNGVALQITTNSTARIVRNQFINNRGGGVMVDMGGSASIFDNDFGSGNIAGLWILLGGHVDLSTNRFSGSTRYAVLMEENSVLFLNGPNTIADTRIGIMCRSSSVIRWDVTPTFINISDQNYVIEGSCEQT